METDKLSQYQIFTSSVSNLESISTILYYTAKLDSTIYRNYYDIVCVHYQYDNRGMIRDFVRVITPNAEQFASITTEYNDEYDYTDEISMTIICC